MLTPENVIALIMIFSLIAYVITGGADFGGGVWDLFASGKRANAQRRLIANVMAPIWEANHIWLILLIVLMFVAFPKAYSTVLTVLHFPATIMLIGIVLRGSAFVFRKYDEKGDGNRRLWSVMFAIGSIIAPFFLGTILGAITIDQPDLKEFFWSWIKLFPLFTGLLTLVICAYLAAVYLTIETSDRDLQRDFRARALVTGSILFVLTLLGTVIAYFDARYLFYELTEGAFAIPLQVATIIAAIFTLTCLYREKYQLARLGAVAHVIVLLFGWMITQYPDLITGHLTIAEAAAPENVLVTTLIILGGGTTIMLPSLLYLYFIFKGKNR